jgi:sterol desaturase/sphingolipid hydroxylase (fatty acid hydroxylase superfamily)
MAITSRLETLSLVLAIAPFLVLLPIEIWQRSRRAALNRGIFYEQLASASPLLPTLLVAGIVAAFATSLYGAVYARVPFRIATGWGSAVACLLLVDFLYYWEHRLSHRIRLLWAVSHSVHHSSPLFDQITGLRVSFVDGFLSPWFYLPAVLIGFDPKLVIACFLVMVGYQQWLHTESIGSLGWFDRVFNSPSNHRVHHATQAQYLDKNYGGIVILWDRLFGTYEPEVEPPHYGLTHPLASTNPIKVHGAEAWGLVRDLWARRSLLGGLRILLWPPDACETGAASQTSSQRAA